MTCYEKPLLLGRSGGLSRQVLYIFVCVSDCSSQKLLKRIGMPTHSWSFVTGKSGSEIDGTDSDRGYSKRLTGSEFVQRYFARISYCTSANVTDMSSVHDVQFVHWSSKIIRAKERWFWVDHLFRNRFLFHFTNWNYSYAYLIYCNECGNHHEHVLYVMFESVLIFKPIKYSIV